MLYIYATRSTTSAQNCGCKDETSGAKGRMECVFSTIYWSFRREFSLAQQQVLFREKFRSKLLFFMSERVIFVVYGNKRESPSAIDKVSIGYFSSQHRIRPLALWILCRAWNALLLQIFSIKVTWYQTSRSIHIRHRCLSKRETKPCIRRHRYVSVVSCHWHAGLWRVFFVSSALLRDIPLHFCHPQRGPREVAVSVANYL